MKGWKTEELGKVAPVMASKTAPSKDEVWLLNLDKVESSTGAVLDYLYVPADSVGTSTCRFDTTNVLYSKLRPYLNKVVMPERDGYATSEMLPLRPSPDRLTREYLTIFLRSPQFVEYISSKVSGAKMPRANTTALMQTRIPLPSIAEQNSVFSEVSRILEAISIKKQQIEQLDLLIKSRFSEMFGDPLSNSNGWNEECISNVCSSIMGGGTPSKSHPEYFEGSIPWLSPKDMKSSMIMDSIDHITEEAVQKSSTNLIPANSVLMVIRSGILKHDLPVALNCIPVTINQDMKAFIPNSKVTAEFLMHYFKAIERDVLSGVKGATADNIDFKAFVKRQMIVPPIERQNQFAVSGSSGRQIKIGFINGA